MQADMLYVLFSLTLVRIGLLLSTCTPKLKLFSNELLNKG